MQATIGGIAAVIIAVICGITLLALFCAPFLNQEEECRAPQWDKTGWNQPDTHPLTPGDYLVRLPLVVEMINTATWDGAKWLDSSNGLECYFQAIEWREVEPMSINTIRAQEGYTPIKGGDYFVLDRADLEELRQVLRNHREPPMEKAA